MQKKERSESASLFFVPFRDEGHRIAHRCAREGERADRNGVATSASECGGDASAVRADR
ncbi:MAG: hypothetical protein ACI4U2_02595 [Christensenellaceae bacterium]